MILTCDTHAIAGLLGLSPPPGAPDEITLTSNIRLTRSGMAMRLLHDSGAPVSDREDRTPAKLIAQAHRYWRILRSEEIDITRLAEREKVSDAWITRVLRLAFLSPEMVKALIKGRRRAGIDGKALLVPGVVAPLWQEQRARMMPTVRRHG